MTPTFRFILLGTLLVLLPIYLRRTYQHSSMAGQSAILKLLAWGGLTLITVVANMVADVLPAPVYLMATIGPTYYGLVLVYLAVYQILNNVVYAPITSTRLLYSTAGLHLIALIFGFLSPTTGDFVDTNGVVPDWTYAAHVFVDYGIMLHILAATILLYRQTFVSRAYRTSVLIRHMLLLLAFVSAFFGYGMVLINLSLCVLMGPTLFDQFTLLYRIGMSVTALFFALSFFVPRPVMTYVAAKLDRVRSEKRERDHQALVYLHRQIAKIAPSALYHSTQQHLEDLLTDIADALLIVRSHQPPPRRLSAKAEAHTLFRLLKHRAVIDAAGTYDPPRATYDENSYFVAIARYLQRLEAREP